MSLTNLLRDVRACRICEADLPLGPRPVLHLASTAPLLIVGQAPGSKVHHSGVPWNDVSGDRLRHWMNVDSSLFYDGARIAILPMGFCYPGAGKSGGDNPPRPECAPHWHKRLLRHLPDLRLTLLVGQYSQRHYLGSRRKGSLTETVEAFHEYGPQFFPLPHPSWHSVTWMRKHPWFELTAIPQLRNTIQKVI